MGSMAETAAERSAKSSVDDDATVFPASTTKHANGTRENSLVSVRISRERLVGEHLQV
jgi:hypothetical protein